MLLTDDFTIFEIALAAIVAYLIGMLVVKRVSLRRKNEMLNRYSSLRKQSLELQMALSQHVLADKADSLTPEGQLTYSDFYRQLKSNHVYNLSDKYLSKVKNSNNPLFLNKAERNLHEQERKLKNARQLIAAAVVL